MKFNVDIWHLVFGLLFFAFLIAFAPFLAFIMVIGAAIYFSYKAVEGDNG